MSTTAKIGAVMYRGEKCGVCDMSYAKCTERVLRTRNPRPCCGTCGNTDTHGVVAAVDFAEVEQVRADLAEVQVMTMRRVHRIAAQRDEARAEVGRIHGVIAEMPRWEEVSDGHLVTTGERVRCEYGGETYEAIELTINEAMEDNPVRHLFRSRPARFYHLALDESSR